MEEELTTMNAEIVEDMPDFESETTETQVSETETSQADTTEKPKEKKLSPYEQAILAEMQRRAEDGDELLANAMQSKDKTIHECWSYVYAQAKKKATGNCAMIEDAVVYGWAHHYYIESKETIDAELKPKTTATPKAQAPKPVKNVLDITQAIKSATQKDDTRKYRREKKKDNLKAGFIPMDRPDTLKEAKKGSREQAKSVVQMDMFADFFAE